MTKNMAAQLRDVECVDPSCTKLRHRAAKQLDEMWAARFNYFDDWIEHKAEIARLKKWIDDLQSKMVVNCVYCGHRYGPGETTPVSMADALKAHVETCPQHPMAKLKIALEEIANPIKFLRERAEEEGGRLNSMAHSITHEPNYLQAIARNALEELSRGRSVAQ